MGRCVLCGAGGYYAFEVNTFSHSIFIFAEVPGKSLTRPIFFKRLHSFIAPFFIYFYYTLTLQSSPPRYTWLTYPHPFARVWAPWHFCKKNKNATPFLHFRDAGQDDVDTEPERRKHSSLTTLWRKKNLSSSTLEICAHPDPEQSHSKYNLLSKGAARSFATVPHNPCLRDIAFPSAIDCTGKHYCESGWVFL